MHSFSLPPGLCSFYCVVSLNCAAFHKFPCTWRVNVYSSTAVSQAVGALTVTPPYISDKAFCFCFFLELLALLLSLRVGDREDFSIAGSGLEPVPQWSPHCLVLHLYDRSPYLPPIT